MSDIAREAGVHQTTVSLALRDDPRLPGETRERIRALAKKMGYRPDPMLSALNFYRTSRDQAKAQPSMAFVMRSRLKRSPHTFYADDLFLKGARRACDRLGYRLVPFQIANTCEEGPRLSRIIRSSGIGGIIIAAIDVNLQALEMAWDDFSAVCIESQHLALSLHNVGNNQTAITRLAVRRMAQLGYRRIGLAVGRVEEASLGKPFGAGYMVEVHEHAGLTPIPQLLLRSNDEPTMSEWLSSWVRRHKIDAVLSNWSSMPDLLKAAGLAVPRDVGLATLDYNPNRGAMAGIRQSHEVVGERAVEGLALLMKTNQRGLIRLPNITFVDGSWEDGPELPPRNFARAG
jgi:DNA-binding LacI/PurR family transcriptional regulator